MTSAQWIDIAPGAVGVVQIALPGLGFIPKQVRHLVLRDLSILTSLSFICSLAFLRSGVTIWQWLVLGLLAIPMIAVEVSRWRSKAAELRFSDADEAAPVIASLVSEISTDPRVAGDSRERIRGLVVEALKAVAQDGVPTRNARVREAIHSIRSLAQGSVTGSALTSALEAVAARSIGSEWSSLPNVGLGFDLTHLSDHAQKANRIVYVLLSAVDEDPALSQSQEASVKKVVDGIYSVLASCKLAVMPDEQCQEIRKALESMNGLAANSHSVKVLQVALRELLSEVTGWRQ